MGASSIAAFDGVAVYVAYRQPFLRLAQMCASCRARVAWWRNICGLSQRYVNRGSASSSTVGHRSYKKPGPIYSGRASASPGGLETEDAKERKAYMKAAVWWAKRAEEMLSQGTEIGNFLLWRTHPVTKRPATELILKTGVGATPPQTRPHLNPSKDHAETKGGSLYTPAYTRCGSAH